ncbi:MAG: NADH-quinone oxidoreductase subunit NuoK [Acidobacteriota bacterium]
MIPIAYLLTLSLLLFLVGTMGFLLRRNVISAFLSIELMLNAANLAFVAFSKMHGTIDGEVVAFFVIAVAAAEVAVGLALVVALYRSQASVDIDEPSRLKW